MTDAVASEAGRLLSRRRWGDRRVRALVEELLTRIGEVDEAEAKRRSGLEPIEERSGATSRSAVAAFLTGALRAAFFAGAFFAADFFPAVTARRSSGVEYCSIHSSIVTQVVARAARPVSMPR